MKLKLASPMGQPAVDALSLHMPSLYSVLGSRRMIVAELVAAERTELADGVDKDAQVTVRITHLEVAEPGDAEDAIREAMKAMYTQRTATATLTEDQEMELTQTTLDRVAGDYTRAEAARLHAACGTWADYARSLRLKNLDGGELRAELTKIADGLTAAAYPGTLETI